MDKLIWDNNNLKTSDIKSASKIFNELKPFCIALSKISFLPQESFDPNSSQLLQALKNLSFKLDSYQTTNDDGTTFQFTEQLTNYVYVPISHILRKDSLGVEQTEYLLNILSSLLRLSWSEPYSFPISLAMILFPLIPFLISSDKENKTLKTKASNEFKLASANALNRLFNSLEKQDYCFKFFQGKMLSSMSHSITILLDIITFTPTDPQPQLIALNALKTLYSKIILDGELLSYILPGNVSALSKLFCKPGLVINYKVICKGLDILQTLLVKVYKDSDLSVEEHTYSNVKDLINSKSTSSLIEIKNSNRPHRNTSWLNGTSSQIKLAFESFLPKLLKRNNTEINYTLNYIVSQLIRDCWISLSNCRLLFIETILNLRNDPLHILSEHPDEVIKVIKSNVLKFDNSIQFNDINLLDTTSFAIKSLNNTKLSENHYDTIIQQQQSMIHKISYDVEINNNRWELKTSNNIKEQSSMVIVNDFFSSKDLIDFKYINIIPSLSKDLEVSISQLVENISVTFQLEKSSSNLDSFISQFLSEQENSSISKKSTTLWIALHLLFGFSKSSHILKNNLDEDTLMEDCLIFEENNHDLSNENQEKIMYSCTNVLQYCLQLFDEISIKSESNSNLLTKENESALCILIYSIQQISSIMKDEFYDELIDYFYIVIENLASSSSKVRSFAQSCSITIANQLYNGSINDMINNNVDYLIESISQRYTMGFTNKITTVLMVICKMTNYSIIEKFKDLLDLVFKTIDYYHGYSDICLEFIKLFEIITFKMKDQFLPKFNNEISITSGINSFGSWGLQNIDQVINNLDTEASVDPISEMSDSELTNKAKNFQEYFDSKIREVDSDDEDDEPDDAIITTDINGISEEVDGNNSSFGKKNDDEDKWVSPIPAESYKILLHFLGYSDRLLMHPSKPLKVQVLRLINLIIPLLSTQYNSFLPQVALIWDNIVLCSLGNDYAIVKPACDCLYEIIHYSGDFISKRFIDLWNKMESDSILLREIRPNLQGSGNLQIKEKKITLHHKFPTVTQNALKALSNMLLEGVQITGLLLAETTVTQMIYCCVHVIPAATLANKSLLIGDIVYSLTGNGKL